MTYTPDSEEVKNAKLISVPEEVFVKNVIVENGGKYYDCWRKKMYEVETDVGVYISAQGQPYDQNNVGGGPVIWSDYVGKRVNVITEPSKWAPVVKFLWIKYVW